MPRIADTGLEYIPLDTTIFQDRKIRRLQRKCDIQAALVYIELLCVIYKEGYYVKWDEDFAFDLADEIRLPEEYIKQVVDACIEVGLLSREMFDAHHILTSRGIQKQYQTVCERSKRKSRVQEYSLLISSEEMSPNDRSDGINSEEKPILSEEMQSDLPAEGISSEEMQQSKVKESKVKESKENSFSSSSSPSPDVEYVPSEEEQEKQEFLSYMFFQDWAWPSKELEKFIAFNKVGGRHWDKMSHAERQAALLLWKQEPAHPPRLGADFIKLWREVDIGLRGLGAPFELRMDAVSDGVSWEKDGDVLMIYCSARLRLFIEHHLDHFKPAIQQFQKSKHLSNRLRYRDIEPW